MFLSVLDNRYKVYLKHLPQFLPLLHLKFFRVVGLYLSNAELFPLIPELAISYHQPPFAPSIALEGATDHRRQEW